MKELALILTNLSSKAIRLQQSRLHNCFSTSTKSCLRKSRRISTASASPSESNHHHHDKGDLFNNRRRRKAKHPGLFEVEDISPPRRSLGIHALPPVRCFYCWMVVVSIVRHRDITCDFSYTCRTPTMATKLLSWGRVMLFRMLFFSTV